MSRVEDLQKEISNLSGKEKRKLKEWLDYQLSTEKDDSTDFRLFYDTMKEALVEKGIPTQPLNIYLKTSNVGGKNFPLVSEFITMSCGNLSQVERMGLYRLFLDILVDNLDQRRIPVSSNTVMMNLPSIPGLVRQCFPGYINAGIISKLATMRRKKVSDDLG